MGFDYYEPTSVVATANNQAAADKAQSEKKPDEQPDKIADKSQSDSPPDQDIAGQIKETRTEMIKQLGIDKAPQEQQDKLLATIDQRVSVAITQSIIQNASDELAKKIQKAIDANEDIEKIVAEAVENDPQLQEKIEDSVTEIWKKILDESKQVLK